MKFIYKLLCLIDFHKYRRRWKREVKDDNNIWWWEIYFTCERCGKAIFTFEESDE